MRALVLSGGGCKGAYQAGALKYILGEMRTTYDIFCGVSVGAINASMLSMFPTGQEVESIENLLELWSNLDSSKIYKRWWPFGRWHAIWKNSFFDSSPLFNLLKSSIDLDKIRKNGKLVSVGTVSLSSGKYTIFDQSSEFFVEAVTASASFPGMLAPIEFLGQLWTDGGVKELSPLKRAVDMGATVIDVIITNPHTRIKKFIEKPTTADVIKRSFDLSTDKIMANDIEKVEMYNQMVELGLSNKHFVKLNIVRPDTNLIEDVLDFRPEKIKEMMERGYQDAQKIKF